MGTESIERIQDDVLQRYLDGDLPEDEMRRVEGVLATSPEDVAGLEQYRRLGELLRAAAVDMERAPASLGERALPDAVFARIEAGIAAEATTAAGGRPPLRAVRGGGRRRVVAGVSLALAAAAAVWLVARSGLAPGGPVAGVGEDAGGIPTVVATAPRGSEVLAIDFGKSTGTVFNVEGSRGEPLAVVWIDDPVGYDDPLSAGKEPEEATR